MHLQTPETHIQFIDADGGKNTQKYLLPHLHLTFECLLGMLRTYNLDPRGAPERISCCADRKGVEWDMQLHFCWKKEPLWDL